MNIQPSCCPTEDIFKGCYSGKAVIRFTSKHLDDLIPKKGEVWEGEFERKGCWNCYHFGYSENPLYADVQETAKLLKKSPSTIRMWLKDGRLDGKLFIRMRPVFQIGSPRKWLVKKESIKLITP